MTNQLTTEIMNFLPKDLANIVSGMMMAPTDEDKKNKELMRANIYELSYGMNINGVDGNALPLKQLIKKANDMFGQSADDMFDHPDDDELLEFYEDNLIGF